MNENVEEIMYEEFYEEFKVDVETAFNMTFDDFAADPRFEKSADGFLEFIRSKDDPITYYVGRLDDDEEAKLSSDPRFVDCARLFFSRQDLSDLTIDHHNYLKDKYIDLFIEHYRYDFELDLEGNIDNLTQKIMYDYNSGGYDCMRDYIKPWTYIDYNGDSDYYSLDGTRMYDYVEDSIASVMKELKEVAVMYDDSEI